MPWIKLLRPTQWLKNLMLYFPPFLGGTLLQDGVYRRGIIPLASFCLVSSSVYIFNDVIDSVADASHPKKKYRPIAAGKVGKGPATLVAALFAAAALALCLLASPGCIPFLLAYMAVSVFYSLKLKDIVLIDIFCISAGFLIRLQAGGEVFGIRISEWLFLSVFLLAIFLSTGKRLGERNMLKGEAGTHRRSLLAYPDGFLEGTMYMSGATVSVTYTMYVISRHDLIYTVPLCMFGLLRFIYLVMSGRSCDPTESLYSDKVLFVVGILWGVMVGCNSYGR